MSSSIGAPCAPGIGLPYASRSRSRIAWIRRRVGGFQSARAGIGRTLRCAAMTERTAQVADVDVLWREEQARTRAPVLFLHGVPTAGDDWLPFLERTGGIAPDLPGFGRSGKPSDFDYSIAAYARFLRTFADIAGLDRFSLVVHDWGSVGLALAQA